MKTAFLSSGAAIALLLASMGGAAALVGLPTSDTLQVGTNNGTTILPETPLIAESVSQTSSFTTLQNSTGTQIMALRDPGTDNVSDIVTATISNTDVLHQFQLKVTLTSDTESPLPTPPGLGPDNFLDETGTAQNLSANFASLFDYGGNPLPQILVMSDADGVPEPSTWAMMLIGFAGLGVFGRGFGRRKAAAA